MSICRACTENRHDLCDRNCGIHGGCNCPCKHDPDYATDEKLMWADLRRKERKENQ